MQNLGEDIELDRLEEAVAAAQEVEDRPSLIVCRTHIAPGAPHKQDTARRARLAAGRGGDPAHQGGLRLADRTSRSSCPTRRCSTSARPSTAGKEQQAEWEERFAAYKDAYPDEGAELERLFAGRLPDGFADAEPPRFHADEGMIATRKASATRCCSGPRRRCPSSSAAPPTWRRRTLTLIDGGDNVDQPGAYGGRNLHFGIREHGMGAIVNGDEPPLPAGLRPTFLIFSDYMKGSIRLAAIMGVPSIFVFTHDSIGVGEDGPTHQPIEQLAHLRAMPNLERRAPRGRQRDRAGVAVRHRADAARRPRWRSRARGCRCGTRPACPTTRSSAAPTCCAKLQEPDEPDLILMATGSEVHICTRAADLLEADGIATRVVSMPCLDRFARQDAAYRDTVLPPDGPRARSGRGGRHAGLGPLGRRRRRGDRDDGLRRLGPGQGALQALRLHARTGRRAAHEPSSKTTRSA